MSYFRNKFYVGLVTLFIIGSCMAVGGGGYMAYSFFRYFGWVEVTAQTTDTDCYDEMQEKGYTVTFCDVRYDYSYKDENFTKVVSHKPPLKGSPASLFINPNQPEQSVDRKGTEYLALTFAKFGFVLAIITGGLFYLSKRSED